LAAERRLAKLGCLAGKDPLYSFGDTAYSEPP
jgi:hypothetical protein